MRERDLKQRPGNPFRRTFMSLAEISLPGPSQDLRQDHHHQARILVVEDSIIQAEILRRTLVKHGFTVDHAQNGLEGLAKTKADRPDLVISDIEMPEMNGFELCRAIRREKVLRDLPIILLTSLSDLEDVMKGLEAGAFNFINKPYDEDRLLAIVEDQLRKLKDPEPRKKNGLLVTCAGQQYTIREKPAKIIDFFLSTYSIAVEKNLELAKAQEELRTLNEQLEDKVQERALALIAETTQRQRAEEELDRTRQYQELILKAAGEGILGVDLNGRISFANPAAVKMLGYEPEDILGQPFDSVCLYSKPDDRPVPPPERPFRATLRDGQRRSVEGIYRRQDGVGFPVQGTCGAIAEGNKITGAVITFQDITERRQANAALRRAMEGAVKALAITVEVRDPYTSGHQVRVAMLACAIAREMGLPEERIEVLRIAGVLHDIGKIQIPAEILSKPTRLSKTEFSLIMIHPQVSYDIIKTVEFPGQVAEIVLQHHERMDGSGYPNGLQGDELLLEARILAVADVVEAMSSHRPYRPALGLEKALEEVTTNQGTRYDSEAVEECVNLFAKKDFRFEA
jgi:PAS domain S-box-containing protein/putative nucleotidyltransferase with HDIG domain